MPADTTPPDAEPTPTPTRTQRRLLDLAAATNTPEPTQPSDLAFLTRTLVQANLPYRDPGDCTYVRRNGDYLLTLQAPPHIGLPYGRYPRLILAYLCREALRTKSREIHLGDSLAAFMRTLGIRPSGGRKGPLRGFRRQTTRLLATTISCSWNAHPTGNPPDPPTQTHTETGTRIASRTVLWWTSPEADPAHHRPLHGGHLLLSPDFYDEILAHPIPLDRRVLRALTSSFALDLYAWLTYRLSRLHRPTSIPWPALAHQFGTQEKALRNFRHATRRALQRIRVFYPHLHVETTTDHLRLHPGPTHVTTRRP